MKTYRSHRCIIENCTSSVKMSEHLRKMMEFMSLVGKLKQVRRTGWVRKKVCGGDSPESVADHMYRMAVLAFLVEPGAGLDKQRCMKIALVHDMAECIVGDITPQDDISKEDKHNKEKTAMKYICSLVEDSVGQEIYSLWQEYEDQGSKEAEFIKDVDKFEMILQAFEYEQMDRKPGYLQEFFDSTEGKFKTEQVKVWVQSLRATRDSVCETTSRHSCTDSTTSQ